MKGLHSPWGSLWSIATQTGWTMDYILWKVSWVNIRMMLTDAPRMTFANQNKAKQKVLKTEADMDGFFNRK